MARLGELLVATKLLTPEQLEQALRAQVMWGGRLGTNIIELGFLDLDQLSHALARQHRLPAALARHFDKADPVLQRKLSPEFADRYASVPLMKVASGMVVIASLGVVDARGVGIISDELGVNPTQLVVSVAAELRIRYHLERAYNIPRGARFLRSRGKTIPPFPAFVTEELSFEDSAVSTPLPVDQRAQLQQLHDAALQAEAAQPAEVEPATPATPATPVATPATPAVPAIDPVQAAPDPIPEIADEGATTKTAVPPPPATPDLGTAATPALARPPIEAVPVPSIHLDTAPLPLVPESGPTLGEALGAPDADDLAIAQSPADEQAQRDRRTYVRVITDQPVTAPPEKETESRRLGRIAIRKVAVTTAPRVAQTLGEATRAIRPSTDRDKVAELVMITLEKFVPTLEAAVMLVLRGDVAIGWKGFCNGGHALPEVAIPLEQPGLIPTSIHRQATARAPAGDLGSIDQLLVQSLGCSGEKELIVVPVMIAGQVMLTIALVASPDTQIQSAESIAIATGAAFARLMRDASR